MICLTTFPIGISKAEKLCRFLNFSRSIDVERRIQPKKLAIHSHFALNSLILPKINPNPMELVFKTEHASSSSSPSLILTSGASGRVNAFLSLRSLKSLLSLLTAVVFFLLAPFRGRRRVMSVEKSKDERHERKATATRVHAKIVPRKSPGSGSSSAVVDQEVAKRRELAIQRVVEERNGEYSIRDFSLFDTGRGDTIFTQSWAPVSAEIRGLVFLLHGLNEHSGRYGEFAKQLNANGYKVYGMDWIGHGGSDGLHAYVHSLDDAVNDMKPFLGKIVAENPGLPCFLFGHSTGGAIILKALLDPNVERHVAGVVLTSPAIGVQPSHPMIVLLAPIISLLVPRYQFGAANKRGVRVSRDPAALVAKYSDPLVYTGSIRVRTGYEILRISSILQKNLSKISVPFLVLHGTADTITDPKASKKLYEEASSADKSIRLLQGYWHDLLFEPEREEIVESIIEWLNARV